VRAILPQLRLGDPKGLPSFFALCACAVFLTGCAGMKLGAGYNMEAKQFFLQIEKPLEPGLKK
jgi:hypothetical protein